MTGSSLAELMIPIAGTLSLTAWLALVFHAGHRTWRAGGTLAAGHVIQIPPPAEAQDDLLTASVEGADLRTIAEVER
jgi:hypothetical protein